jgi:hypothetical protein
VHITDYFQFIFSVLPPDLSNQPTNNYSMYKPNFEVLIQLGAYIKLPNKLSQVGGGGWGWGWVGMGGFWIK